MRQREQEEAVGWGPGRKWTESSQEIATIRTTGSTKVNLRGPDNGALDTSKTQ